ncbi:hypothetical protein EV127DRAFT_420532 [Xylaria flabelliformis]|nr:hypothetical protein EV127DRAFT_420532 [Xylaria flabelliformis]
MSLNARARFVRVQPTHLYAICQASSSVSHISPRLPFSLSQVHRYTCSPYSRNVLQSQFRLASSASATRPKTPDISLEEPPPTSPEPLSDPLNPPASTRPPPLDLPVRDPSSNLFTHLFRLGKAYTTFYKTGLKAVFTNRRLLRDLPDTPPPGLPSPATSVRGGASAATIAGAAQAPGSALSRSLDKSANPTRASLLLRARVRHDSARLPLFALIVLICGEFTPLIVLIFPRLTPYTCRIPTQAAVIRKSIEARRAASVRALSYVNTAEPTAVAKVADGHICRTLGLGSPLWDRTGFDVPWAKTRAADVVRRIVQDDAMLKNGGGVRALVDDEVVLACEERGIDTLGKDVASLRSRLEAWVARSAPSQTGNVEAALEEATDKVRRLLLGLEGSIR